MSDCLRVAKTAPNKLGGGEIIKCRISSYFLKNFIGLHRHPPQSDSSYWFPTRKGSCEWKKALLFLLGVILSTWTYKLMCDFLTSLFSLFQYKKWKNLPFPLSGICKLEICFCSNFFFCQVAYLHKYRQTEDSPEFMTSLLK